MMYSFPIDVDNAHGIAVEIIPMSTMFLIVVLIINKVFVQISTTISYEEFLTYLKYNIF
jgi:hypothetical protein